MPRTSPKQRFANTPGASPVEKDNEGLELPPMFPVPVPTGPVGGVTVLIPVIVPFTSTGVNTTNVVMEAVAELLAETTDEVEKIAD